MATRPSEKAQAGERESQEQLRSSGVSAEEEKTGPLPRKEKSPSKWAETFVPPHVDTRNVSFFSVPQPGTIVRAGSSLS